MAIEQHVFKQRVYIYIYMCVTCKKKFELKYHMMCIPIDENHWYAMIVSNAVEYNPVEIQYNTRQYPNKCSNCNTNGMH